MSYSSSSSSPSTRRHRRPTAAFLLMTIVMTTLSSFATVTTAFTSPSDLPTTPSSPHSHSHNQVRPASLEQLRQDWADRSVSYYSKIMREERRRNSGQLDSSVASSEEYQHDFQVLAKKHYFALRKIKDGQHTQAEQIYKRIINEIVNENEDENCDHAKLAVTTLLLALHCQRMGDMKKTRSVFLSFFRVVTMSRDQHHDHRHDVDGVTAAAVDNDHDHHPQCACSAKVLGAFALFEMKQGNAIKSLQIAIKAVEFDPTMEPVLNWKQFRDVRKRRQRQRRVGGTNAQQQEMTP
jgi:hypothetical protein